MPDHERDRLDDMEFQYGPQRGRLLKAVNLLTDAQVAVGTHAAYCRNPRDPAEPTRDIQDVLRLLERAKGLIQSVAVPGCDPADPANRA